MPVTVLDSEFIYMWLCRLVWLFNFHFLSARQKCFASRGCCARFPFSGSFPRDFDDVLQRMSMCTCNWSAGDIGRRQDILIDVTVDIYQHSTLPFTSILALFHGLVDHAKDATRTWRYSVHCGLAEGPSSTYLLSPMIFNSLPSSKALYTVAKETLGINDTSITAKTGEYYIDSEDAFQSYSAIVANIRATVMAITIETVSLLLPSKSTYEVNVFEGCFSNQVRSTCCGKVQWPLLARSVQRGGSSAGRMAFNRGCCRGRQVWNGHVV